MKSVNVKKGLLEKPGVEVVVRSGDVELAIIAFFEDGRGGWDILVGVNNPQNRGALQSALQSAAEAVGKAAFQPIPTNLHEGGTDTPPF